VSMYPGSTDAPHGAHPVDPATRDVGDTSLGDLVGQVTGDLSRLMRAELALAKAEAKEEAAQAGRGAGMLAGAGVGAHLLLIFLSLAVMFGLGAWMPLGWAALIVAVIWGIVAAALASSGRKALKTANPTLPQTTETLKEDAQWVKNPRG
jgi:uncharacterized membrane protein YqjE